MPKKITKEIMDKAYNLYLEGKNYKEISSELGIGLSTVKQRLKKEYNVMPMKNLPIIDLNLFKPLWEQNNTDLEISNKLGIPENVCSNVKNKYNNWSINGIISNVNNYLQEYILGSLLGDLHVSSPDTTNRSRLAIVHGKDQERLFMYNVELLGDLMGQYKLSSYLDQRTNKEYFTYRGNSKASEIFTNIWRLTYSNNGKKLVTQEWLDKINSPLALAFWFMDDGTYRGTIATNGFSEPEIDLLIKWMWEKWNIVCTKQQNVQSTVQYVIHLSSHSRFEFEKLIFPYVDPSMYYKLKYAILLLDNN